MTTKAKAKPKKKKKETNRRICEMIVRNIPVDVRAQFKSFCARRGISMNSKLIELMQITAKDE